jgi:hypothetical protein
MSARSWIRKPFQRKPRPLAAQRRTRPRLEVLEDRLAPATLIVNGVADNTSADDFLTLREAIALVNAAGDANAALGRSLTASEANQITGTFGSFDTIQFDPTVFATPQTISLSLGELPINRNLDIEGPGAGLLTISGNHPGVVFEVSRWRAPIPVLPVTVTLTGLKIADAQNTGFGGLGGGIFNDFDTTLTVTDCTLTRNSADIGGGIENDGTLTVTNCTLTGNSASYGGGIDNSGSLTLTGCTLTSNSAYDGGGISNDANSTLTVTNCTLDGNTATNSGGGIFSVSDSNSHLTIANTIIAHNSAPHAPDVFDGVEEVGGLTGLTDRGHNLIGDPSGSDGFSSNADDLLGLDPLLGPLQDNGGPTQTMALLPGSPAIDHGDNARAVGPDGTPLTTDQRGFARVVDGTVDIGAFEVQHFVVTTTADSGPDSLRAAVANADLAGGSTITFNGQSGVQTVDVTPTVRDLAHIQGPVIVTSRSGPVTLNVNDQAGSVKRNYTLATASLSWAGPAPIQFDHLGSLALNATTFNDTVTVQSLPGNTVLVNGGAGSNTLVGPDASNTWLLAQPASHEGTLNGTLVFDSFAQLTGGQGLDRFVVPDGAYIPEALSGGDGLHGGSNNTLDLSACTSALSVHLFSSVYGGTVTGVVRSFALCQNVIGGRGNDRFLVDQGYGLTGLDGGPGNNTLDLSPYYRSPQLVSITGPNSGYVAGEFGAFANIQNLVTGSTNDNFGFRGTGSLDGTIDGGGGSNTLDYSHYVGDVTVDLALNLASLVNHGAAGGAFHVANVTGSIGNDLLVGDAGANVLIGGTGRNLLIGGAGADALTGGGRDNLLIGGSTSYDQNLAALNALFAEWTSANSLSVRMGNLSNGGGLNVTYVLNPDAVGGRSATVFDDAAADLFVDGSGLSWFFVHPPDDTINYGAGPLVSGDVVSVIS